MIYFDTSYVIKCYLNEAGSAEVRRLAESANGIGCCLHGRLEFWTAVKRNVREKLITPVEADATFQRFEEDEANGVWHWFPVQPETIEMACRRVASASDSIFLRAADALHLACAEENGFTDFYTHDGHLLAAAPIFGIEAKDVIVAASAHNT